MTRLLTILAVLATAHVAGLAGGAKSGAAEPPARLPNIVVIFIDDLGYGDIGPFGATGQQTPNLDRMATEGLKLTSFYAAPVCSVSRAQLLTGCYGVRVGVPGVYDPASPNGLHPAEVTIAERLAPLGYATACIGKWHLGDQPEFLPTRQGFDRYYGIPYSNDMQRVSVETGARVVPLLRDERVEAVRRGPWKLAIAPQQSGLGKNQAQPPEPASLERPRLYDLAADIGETTDVAAAHPEIVAELTARAVAMQRELGDPASPARRPAGTVAHPQTLYPTVPEPPKQQPARKPAAAKATGDARPNIVLFLADDLGYGEIGCYGNRQAITPHLDRFAATGVRLTDCHSASSVCSPSRSSLLTGRTPYRNGVFTWIPEQSPIHLRSSEITLPKLLKSAGYDPRWPQLGSSPWA